MCLRWYKYIVDMFAFFDCKFLALFSFKCKILYCFHLNVSYHKELIVWEQLLYHLNTVSKTPSPDQQEHLMIPSSKNNSLWDGINRSTFTHKWSLMSDQNHDEMINLNHFIRTYNEPYFRKQEAVNNGWFRKQSFNVKTTMMQVCVFFLWKGLQWRSLFSTST